MLYQGDSLALRRFSIVMIVLGFSFIFVIPFSTEILPAQFRWSNPEVNLADERMIIAMYIALGVCFLMGAKNPVGTSIIIDYTIISSILHGGVMLYYALKLKGEMPHMWGDVPLLFGIAVGLAIFHPRRLARRDG